MSTKPGKAVYGTERDALTVIAHEARKRGDDLRERVSFGRGPNTDAPRKEPDTASDCQFPPKPNT